MFNSLLDKVNTMHKENKEYKKILKNSITFTNLKNVPDLTNVSLKKSTHIITTICPDINKEKATIISKLLPAEESYLDILYAKETKTNIDYWIIPTNKYIWLINEKKYGIIPYSNIKTCSILKNNIMSKSISINNIIIEINGNDNKANNFVQLITNNEFRKLQIEEKTKYLCNIVPIYQSINDINSGISIDNNSNIVFHSKNENYKTTKEDLINYEVLIDNISSITKNQDRNTKINSFQNGCYSISIRITTKEKTFLIPILEQNSLGTKYNIHDSIYQNNFSFAKNIIYKLDDLYKQKN